MYGAIIGDLAGSIYEYDQTRNIIGINTYSIIKDNSFYSDDTILTIAISDAILNDCDYEKYLKIYINKYEDYKPNFKPYFEKSFSPNMIKWSKGKNDGNSAGNGALMRISPVGYMFNKENEVVENARLATIPSHNSVEAVASAELVALTIFYARLGMEKEEIFNQLCIKPEFKPFREFNKTCNETLGNCFYALHEANSFEDAIKTTLLMGGDTDTNCAIVGSMAEAIYGIDDSLIEEANKKLPSEFIKVLEKSYKEIR